MGKGTLWAGRVLSAIPVLMMLMGGAMKIAQAPPVVEGFTKQFGYPASAVVPIGVVEVLCVVLYAIPQTSVLGAILTTGYLGGAINTHVRIGDGFIPPLMLGVFVWAGLFLRDERVRALIPLRAPVNR